VLKLFGEMKWYWEVADGNEAFADLAAAVAMAESSGDHNAISSSGDYGLWQINAAAHPQYNRGQLLEPHYNAMAAVAISENGTNWRPWCTAYTDCRCGTQGGRFDPRGASCVGRIYRRLRGSPVIAPSGEGRQHQHGPTTGLAADPNALPEVDLHFTNSILGWHRLMRAFGHTVPTYARATNRTSGKFPKALGLRRG